ncbi:MAG: cadmium-translocating P-type ATPase [Candidatus Cloacimonetes bacterium]|nr:cadmium-translocating P-type ATPase [Candidatus Cloacimonadota bacterium]MDD3563372.1 heavy metal translocating P-type ATPase [Candidatus Cloacimonadota bacterium]
MTIREYDVHNLDCANCSAKIEREIANLAEVSQVNLDFMNRRLIVQYENPAENVLDRLNQIASGIEPGVKIAVAGSEHEHKRSNYVWFIYAGLLIWLLNTLLPLGQLLFVSLSFVAYLLVSGRVLHGAFKEVTSKQLMAEHFLMSIASIGAMYLGEYTEAIAVMALYELGQYLESKAIAGSRKAVSSLVSLKPEKAHVKDANGLRDLKLSQVKPSDIILVYPGERIPLDGRILKGESTLDTSSVSGESEPLLVEPGAEIFAGCLNQSGLLEIEVLKSEGESMVARIMAMIDNASARKSSQERFITRFARIYTPVVVGLAVLVFLVPVIFGFPADVWFKRALVFLIVSCPCALVISIPLTYYIGIGLAARKGIIFKGSVFLDSLRQIKSIVFDKTGTITTGKLSLTELLPTAESGEEELKQALWLCEYSSNHPFALAVKSALSYDFDHALLEYHKEYPGKGIKLSYAGKTYLAGNLEFISSFGIDAHLDTTAMSAVHVAANSRYLGAATFSDEIKDDMIESLAKLRAFGVKKLYMLSGDRNAKAENVAQELKLDGFKAELLPNEKLHALEEIMAEQGGLVAYSGDGMNDAPVLARADIGIAMGAIGAQASIESADIVLLNDKPEQLVQAFELSRRTNNTVWQNIILALGIKVIVMVLGVTGISGLWEAIIADVGVTLLVIFNSLRMIRSK